MFKCENCAQQISARIPSKLITTIIRKKIYKPIKTQITNGSGRHVARKKRSGGKEDHGYWLQNGGEGYETVQEIRVCPDCAILLSGQKPLIVENR